MSAWTDHHAFPLDSASLQRIGRADLTAADALDLRSVAAILDTQKTLASKHPLEVRNPHAADTAEKGTKPLPAMDKAASADVTGRISPCHSAHLSRGVAL